MMNRRDVLKRSVLSAGALASGIAQASSASAGMPGRGQQSFPKPPHRTNGERMPNILWVCTDQQRFDTIQGLSNNHIHTPNLKKFMSEGVTCTNAYVQAPICSPSRASFNTGRYAHTTGLRANGQRIRPTERLVSRILADYNYTCGLSGKLHLSPCFAGRVEDRIDDGYQQFWWSHDVTDQWPGQNQWYVWLDRQGVKLPPKPDNPELWALPISPKYTQTAFCADKAIDFMRQQRVFNPWMMSVNIFQPHHPFWPTEEYMSHYKPSDMPNPSYKEGELDNKPIWQQVDHEGAYGGIELSFAKTTPEKHREFTAAYYAMIEQVDTDFGRMMQVLEETGQADNTIVIFMSDHGEMLGDHGIYLKGPYFYDATMHVPLIIRWPHRFQAGLRTDAMVEMVDLAPTLMDAAGIPVPAGMQGRSLMSLLTGATKVHRDSVYSEYFDANAVYPVPPMGNCVRTADHKLTYWNIPRDKLSGKPTGELYDLKSDPGEVINLWNNAHTMDVQQQMLQLLVARMVETVDPLPVRTTPW